MLLWLTGLTGGFVQFEPGPYEIASTLTILVFAVGLRLQPSVIPLVLLLALYNIGLWISAVPVLHSPAVLTWVLISSYLSVTAVFFAAMLGANMKDRLASLLNGYVLASAIASIAGIIGYFNVVPELSNLFLRFGRVRATFKDPNVLGAFLVLPMLLAMQRLLVGRFREAIGASMLLALFAVALFLSFSRGAWLQFAFSAMLLIVLTFVNSTSTTGRVRIAALAALGVVALAVLVATLISVDQVAELFQERANLEQSYDLGDTGRFGRHLHGLAVALEHPLGIGPLQFSTIFPEDPHNAYLNAFLSGGWLAGFTYAALVIVTLVNGFRFAFLATPWQRAYLAIYAAFAGCAVESLIIDSDHWRHFFLLLGVLWGLMAASHPYPAQLPPASRSSRRTSVGLPARQIAAKSRT